MEIAKQHNLRIAFLQDNPKRFGSASRVRYEQYKSAQTLEEALQRGARPEDLTWTGRRKLFRIFPEPLRRPLSWQAAPSTAGQWVPDWSMLRCVLLYKGGVDPWTNEVVALHHAHACVVVDTSGYPATEDQVSL